MKRYGLCCPNNPDYRKFVHAQTEEIVSGYEIDTMFFDMVWWPAVCLCKHCERRSEKEIGSFIPKIIDWHDPVWCAFQDARESWILEFAMELKELTHRVRPGTLVYHNFALSMSNWSKGMSFAMTHAHDFLGGDFYGGRDEQLVISKLMLNLSQSGPTEFMTTVARNLIDHEQLQSQAELITQTYGAMSCNSAFLMIAAMDPDGKTSSAMTERINKIYKETSRYEKFLGGKPIEDIGVYFSDASKMNFSDNGKMLNQMDCGAKPDYPHFESVKGACKKLAAAHLPFGVITRQHLKRLSEYKVIVLPNILRMHDDEVEAFRAYVSGGGKLYASRLTSLTSVTGNRGKDFALADLFGCHFDGENEGRLTYVAPVNSFIKSSIAPERYLGHRMDKQALTGSVKLTAGKGTTLATLSLPFGYPEDGTTTDENWASIHSDPPWTHLSTPSIVSNLLGKGRVIYSAADIEAGKNDSGEKLFITLIENLLDESPQFMAATYASVWMNAFDQEANNRIIVNFLNYQLESPAIPITNIPFNLSAPKGKKFVSLLELPSMRKVDFKVSENSRLEAQVEKLESFAMYAAAYR